MKSLANESTRKIQIISQPNGFTGYVYGFRQPVLRYSVNQPLVEEAELLMLDRLLSQKFGTEFESHGDQKMTVIESHLMHWTKVILEKGNHPVFELARRLASKSGTPNFSTILQPCFNHTAALLVVNRLIANINSVLGGMGQAQEFIEETTSGLSRLMKTLATTGLRGFNQWYFLKAAFELGVPWTQLEGTCFQLGFGSAARWIDSSVTDATSTLAMTMVRNKVFGASVMRKAGLPVPPHILVTSLDIAVQAAEKLGYPVVVKPADLDGGIGVKANLLTPESVRKAFVIAFQLSKNILVEKHVAGRDYRIHVVHGKVHGVLERVPGGITGNAHDTVKDLLMSQNHERKIAQDDRRHLHHIELDEEAEEALLAQDMKWDSVPEKGRFVRLRSASNVASGGVPVPVPLDVAHADNLRLAVRAARVMRLDVAGIDLLVPDISNSWLETGAYICEVNAQPQMYTTLHKPMLVSLLNGCDGRIPVAIVISGESTDGEIGLMLHRKLLDGGVTAGLVQGGTVWIGTDCVSRTAAGSFAQTRMLCFDSTVQAMVICIKGDEIMNCGWPVDSCNVFVARSGAAVTGGKYLAQCMAVIAELSPGLVMLDAALNKMSLPDARSVFANANDFRVVAMKDREELNHVVSMAASAMFSAAGKQARGLGASGLHG